jgi:hypothetical protein
MYCPNLIKLLLFTVYIQILLISAQNSDELDYYAPNWLMDGSSFINSTETPEKTNNGPLMICNQEKCGLFDKKLD